jgi:EAL domain-containing protein (putative c-di-GMP-specific phosphodiesterase class I)
MHDDGNRVLILDDERPVGELIADVAASLGFQAQHCGSFAEFKYRLPAMKPTLIVLDINLRDSDGIEVMRYLEATDFGGDLILVSGFDRHVLRTAEKLARERNLRLVNVLAKPFDIGALERVLAAAKKAPVVSEADLFTAINKGHIVPYLQPKIDCAHGDGWRVDSFEVLARWQHPQFGLLAPAQFIPLAEKCNLIEPLTWALVRETLRQCADLLETHPHLSLAFNIAPRMLHDLSMPDRLADAAGEHGIDGRQLLFEITETGAMEDARNSMDILSRMRLKGFLLSIDDFGTGYSSLAQLYRMPFTELKIDRSFVKELDTDPDASVIVSVLVDMAHRLKLSVCAEGVESASAFAQLREMGCDKAQGYLFSAPAEPAVILARIRSPDTRTPFRMVPPASPSSGIRTFPSGS